MHSQNLNDSGSAFWFGRAWFNRGIREKRVEWAFGRRADFLHFKIQFGEGDGNDAVQLAVGIPFLFSVFLTWCGVFRCKPCQIGFSVHDSTFRLYTLCRTDEWNSKDPWWRKGLSWDFPWTWNHYKTEILPHNAESENWNYPVHVDTSGVGENWIEGCSKRDAAKALVSKTYPYTYIRKNGEIQKRTATVYVDRMTWRMKWWPLLPFKKVRVCISIQFDDEVGERTGSWKGGCTGCGYELIPGETPEQSLRRMERDRKFN